LQGNCEQRQAPIYSGAVEHEEGGGYTPSQHDTGRGTGCQPAEANGMLKTLSHPCIPSPDAAHHTPPLSKDALSKLLFQSYCQGLQSTGQPAGRGVEIAAVDQENQVLVEKISSWYKVGISMAEL
jgi:hypothetical protein